MGAQDRRHRLEVSRPPCLVLVLMSILPCVLFNSHARPRRRPGLTDLTDEWPAALLCFCLHCCTATQLSMRACFEKRGRRRESERERPGGRACRRVDRGRDQRDLEQQQQQQRRRGAFVQSNPIHTPSLSLSLSSSSLSLAWFSIATLRLRHENHS